ncbi:LytTR family DNA-binding domain-containing protein [Cytobacillus purgationiresistens]|uniref:DNA-binding LytR/AlgR family response regulator n=1 Tax=Cytobacillus purgationiresistens TaxID=863449 RepID=A0ABU0AQQ1_9BACI|nr:LytTR family DNA-binding domain-containing protein [Cytobacillus purgationiresistens]MDQ0273360.1 DNA-binding LytR/AlgR family response regulator [Cytobacillus purgationiresistens]
MENLILKENTKIHIFPIGEIMFVEAIEGKVNISLSSGTKVDYLKYTLKTIEEILCKDDSFFKVHRSFILNMKYVRRIEKYSEASYYAIGNSFEIPISRKCVKKLVTTLGDIK